jgi:hypothetical protein
MKLSLPRSGQT